MSPFTLQLQVGFPMAWSEINVPALQCGHHHTFAGDLFVTHNLPGESRPCEWHMGEWHTDDTFMLGNNCPELSHIEGGA